MVNKLASKLLGQVPNVDTPMIQSVYPPKYGMAKWLDWEPESPNAESMAKFLDHVSLLCAWEKKQKK